MNESEADEAHMRDDLAHDLHEYKGYPLFLCREWANSLSTKQVVEAIERDEL